MSRNLKILRALAAATMVGTVPLTSGCASLGAGALQTRVARQALPATVPVLADSEAGAAGLGYLGSGNYAFAAAYLKQATKTEPENAALWTAYASALDNLGQFAAADTAYARVLSLVGQTTAYHNNRGYSFMLRGDFARAGTEFEAALRLAPGNMTVLNNRELLRKLSRASRTV